MPAIADKTSAAGEDILSGYETKYVFPNTVAPQLREWLRSACLPDPVHPSGLVASIYYDTADWHFLREKLNSDLFKSKVRLRWYAEIRTGKADEWAFLEAKFKNGALRGKVHVKAPFSGAWLERAPLEDPRLLAIRRLLAENGVAVPGMLRPVFEIRYERWRFVEPTTASRVCVDCGISTGRVNRQSIPFVRARTLDEAVFELKGPVRECPVPLRSLFRFGCRKESFSKYLSCYMALTGLSV